MIYRTLRFFTELYIHGITRLGYTPIFLEGG